MDQTEHNDKNVGRILRDTFNSQAGSSSQDGDHPELVRTSRLAVVACVLAIVGLLLLPGLLWVAARGPAASIRGVYQGVLYGVSVSAAVLGIISLARIGASAGRLAGRGFACIGVAAPVAQGLLFIILVFVAVPANVFVGIDCSSNLAGIGKAMLIYANDYEDQLPRAGGPGSKWTGRIADWTAPNRQKAYGLDTHGRGGHVSMSASLYLLVKYCEVEPKRFMCGERTRTVRGGYAWTAWTKETWEQGITEFKLDADSVLKGMELIDFWDFGPNPPKHCSYAYHMLYGTPKLTVSSPPGFAVAADRNPWMDSPAAKARDFSAFQPDIPPFNGTSIQSKAGNAFRHQGEGQNVMFLDTHVEFEKRPFCGLDDDNIYTSWDGPDKARGVPPKLGSAPADARDSLLVNDPVGPSR